jgi:hypothetical protein
VRTRVGHRVKQQQVWAASHAHTAATLPRNNNRLASD